MTEHDLPMLHDWLNRPHIFEWWGGEAERPTLDEVLKHYLPRVLAAESVTPYIAMLEGEPIGYAQSYVAPITIEQYVAMRRRVSFSRESSSRLTVPPCTWFKQDKLSSAHTVRSNPEMLLLTPFDMRIIYA
jgi:hypothetical protein